MNDGRLPNFEELVAVLVMAWSDALNMEVTPQSDFLALGGTSITAMVIADAVAERYGDCKGMELCALQSVFECPNLLAMAERLSGFMRESQTVSDSGSMRE
jgi:Phosphopantetheine attachment site